MTRTAITSPNQFGRNTDAVMSFLSAIETLTADQLTRAEAADITNDPRWPRLWEAMCCLAVLLGRQPAFDAAIDAAWEHAAKRPDFEAWDHVWENSACHTAAVLVIGRNMPAEIFNHLHSAFLAAGVVTPEPIASNEEA